MMSARASIARTAARVAGLLSRTTGRGGTSLPGKVLLRLDPEAIRRLAGDLRDGSVVISATNGKTTTATMFATILRRDGRQIVHNEAGANMAGGVASTLLRSRGDLGLFEVDEFWLDAVADALQPRLLVLGNLFRDQLDRYGELEAIAERWRALARTSEARLVLNADDPAIADLGREAQRPLYFGIEDSQVALAQAQHASDTTHCRSCGAPYRYEHRFVGHLGSYRCDGCHTQRPNPQIAAHHIRLDGIAGSRFTLALGDDRREVQLPLPGLYNVYNALAAAAGAYALEIDAGTIVAGLEAVQPAFGRGELVDLAGRPLRIMLVKNPAGANEILRTLALEPGPIDLLAVLNDQIADGRDVSWIWDADVEAIASSVGRVVCSGTRAAEMALRMKYAGVDVGRIVVCDELATALDLAAAGADGTLYAIPTYTAMLELRRELVRRGVAGASFA